MKACSNAKLMTRRQARLWEQRRLLHVQQLQAAVRRELDEQWRVRAHPDNRADSWWSRDDGDGGIRRGTTCSSTSCNPYPLGTDVVGRQVGRHVEAEWTEWRMNDGGCRSRSTIDYSSSAESLRDLLVEKACNGTLEAGVADLVTDGTGRCWQLDSHGEYGVEHDGRLAAASGDRIHCAAPHKRDLGRDESRQDRLGTEWAVESKDRTAERSGDLARHGRNGRSEQKLTKRLAANYAAHWTNRTSSVPGTTQSD
ncbi:hypothetical protein PF011_g20405 [Phytophthora fragariae]|uniref:Uncharacterized protein n=1 Tax=Phytophthora fragariae TaxID=53985 RepID=A0A6A3IR20_9STRA|nr:hypothetical protein PF011_g20405 [Phytophthora fragariae]